MSIFRGLEWLPGFSRGFQPAPQLMMLIKMLPGHGGLAPLWDFQLETSNTGFSHPETWWAQRGGRRKERVYQAPVRMKFYNWRSVGWTQEKCVLGRVVKYLESCWSVEALTSLEFP